ncbi:MAG: HDIG domain-containing protein [Clostridiales bacterium]|nr:HDIG domain-containing protein [Clostridiales bacterium]
MTNALYKQIDLHIMQDEKPSIFMDNLLETDELQQYPFSMLSDLVKVEQSPQHHPEGNVWVHTMMVLDIAAQLKEKSCNPRVFMWSALLHDLGKVPATKVRKGKITAYDHDKMGVGLAVNFLKEFNEDSEFISKVAAMVRWHMQILFVVKDMPFARPKEMVKQVPVDEMALLGYCDRMGRGEITKEREDKEKENIRIFLEKSK